MEGGGALLKKPFLENGNGAGVSSSPPPPALIFSTFVAVCGSFTYGCAISFSSPAQDGITQDLGLSVAAFSMFGSVLTVGGMIGALFCGRMTAILGCKYTMWLSQVFCSIGWVAIALAPSSWWLDMGRLSIGFGVGFLTYVLLTNCGCSIVFLVGNFISWRTLALMGLVPAILQLVGLFFIPESPRWLNTMNFLKEDSDAKVMDLFQKKYAYSLTVGLGLMLLQQLGGSSGVSFYASGVIEKAGFPTSTGTIIISFIQVPSAAAGLFLMDFAGRRPLLMVSAGGMCFCSFLMGLSFILQAYIAAFSIGVAGIPWIMMSEIFPMSVKALAGTLVALVNWSSSWLVTYTFNFMLQWSPAGKYNVINFSYEVSIH
ncbi:unnamed protein product [Linum tenue]|uniref:Major facilitator superfamily (MFS) profile domain-containing protein n=1 Tax=Linum tenue TaxID=586396 RepID=A0AAV0HFK0_9ROSI|nr:unnamed protein product [Linum tenue]